MRQLELTERLLRLRSVPVFRSLSTGELAPLAQTMRSATFEKGDFILREDEPPRAFHLLLTGSVTMRRRGNFLRTITAPGGVGFLSLLARNAGSTEAIAEAHCESFEVRADAVEELFEDHFPVLLGTMRWIAERLIDENKAQKPPPFVPPQDAFDHLIGDRELGIVERIFLLRRTRAFKAANVNSTARLARRMHEVRLPAGAKIWQPGDKADTNLFIVKGHLDLRWRYKDEDKVQDIGPGYIVGGAESIANQPRWNELVTRDPTVLLRGSRESLIDMFEDDLEAGLKFMSLLAGFLISAWDTKAEEAARGRASLVNVASPTDPDAEPASAAP